MESKESLVVQSIVALELGDSKQAVLLLERARELDPADATLAVRLGSLFLEQDQFARAVELFEEVLRSDPSNRRALTGLAEALRATQRHEQASVKLRDAVQVERTANNLILLGIAESRIGRDNEAEVAFREAVALEPENEEALFNLALEVRIRSSSEALELLQRAIDIDPDYAAALTELGYAYWSEGRLEDAENVLRRSREIDPDQPWAAVYMAIVSRDLGQYREAEALLVEASTVSPMWAVPEWLLGTLLQKSSRMDEARRHFEKATALEPDDPSSAYLLADFSYAEGDMISAGKWLRVTLQLDPTHRRALELLRKIGEKDS